MSDALEKRRRLANELKKANEEIEKKFLIPLTKKRQSLVDKCQTLEETLKMHKEEISQIDAELETTLIEAEMNEFEGNGFKLFFSQDIYPRVEDPVALFKWMEVNNKYDILSANMIKKTETTRLIDQGETPDGISVSSYNKFKVYKSKK